MDKQLKATFFSKGFPIFCDVSVKVMTSFENETLEQYLMRRLFPSFTLETNTIRSCKDGIAIDLDSLFLRLEDSNVRDFNVVNKFEIYLTENNVLIRKHYSNFCIIEGESTNLIQNGFGIKKIYNNNVNTLAIHGIWRDGKFTQGKAVIITPTSVYKGDVSSNYEFQGFGFQYRMDWSKKSKIALEYVGEFVSNKREGVGLCFSVTNTFRGNFHDNLPHGYGESYNKLDRSFSEGEFYNGYFTGYGIKNIGEKVIIGQFFKDNIQGYAWLFITKKYRLNISMETRTFGYFEQGELHGYGMTTIDLGYYEGEFIKGKVRGYGYYYCYDRHETIFRGKRITDNYFQGIKCFREGYQHIGTFDKNFKAEGLGIVYVNRNRFILIGEFHVEQICGIGVYLNSKGDIYAGEADMGDCHGYGIFLYNQRNEKYEGQWKRNIKNGYGTYFLSDGRVYEGFVADENLSGYARMTYPNGDVYEGQFNARQRNGYGRLYTASGKIYEGLFKDDSMEGWIFEKEGDKEVWKQHGDLELINNLFQ